MCDYRTIKATKGSCSGSEGVMYVIFKGIINSLPDLVHWCCNMPIKHRRSITLNIWHIVLMCEWLYVCRISTWTIEFVGAVGIKSRICDLANCFNHQTIKIKVYDSSVNDKNVLGSERIISKNKHVSNYDVNIKVSHDLLKKHYI